MAWKTMQTPTNTINTTFLPSCNCKKIAHELCLFYQSLQQTERHNETHNLLLIRDSIIVTAHAQRIWGVWIRLQSKKHAHSLEVLVCTWNGFPWQLCKFSLYHLFIRSDLTRHVHRRSVHFNEFGLCRALYERTQLKYWVDSSVLYCAFLLRTIFACTHTT